MVCNDGRFVHCFIQAVPLLGSLYLMEIRLLSSYVKDLHVLLKVCWGQDWVSSDAQTWGEQTATHKHHPSKMKQKFCPCVTRGIAVLQGSNLQMDEPDFQNQ